MISCNVISYNVISCNVILCNALTTYTNSLSDNMVGKQISP